VGESLGLDGGHPFFPLSDFKLRYGEPLKFPTFLAASRNYFNPNWSGLRRVKNVVMVLEYVPDSHSVTSKSPEETLKVRRFDFFVPNVSWALISFSVLQDAMLDDSRSSSALSKALTLLASSTTTSPSHAHGDLKLTQAELKVFLFLKIFVNDGL